MPVSGNWKQKQRCSSNPISSDTDQVDDFNCKQIPLSKRSGTKHDEYKRLTRPARAEEESPVTTPLRVDIRVKPRRTQATLLTTSCKKTPLQLQKEDKWILYNHTSSGAREQNLASYQYNSYRQRKEAKTRSKSATPTPNLSVTPTYFETTYKGNARQRAKFKVLLSETPKTYRHENIASNSADQGVIQKRSTEELLHHDLSQYEMNNDRVLEPIEISPSQKAMFMKEDGSIKESNILVALPTRVNSKDEVANRLIPHDKKNYWVHSEKSNSPYYWDRKTQRSSSATATDLYVKRQKESYHSLTDSKILEIMETDSSRFECFDSPMYRKPQTPRPPLIEMPEKVWKVKMSSRTHKAEKFQKGVTEKSAKGHKRVNEKGRVMYSEPCIIACSSPTTNNLSSSDVISGVNIIKDYESFSQMIIGVDECRCSLKKSKSTPTTTELRIWDNPGPDTKVKKPEKETLARKSKSTIDCPSMKSIIEGLERSQSRGKFKRVKSPKVAESKSLYDYGLVLI